MRVFTVAIEKGQFQIRGANGDLLGKTKLTAKDLWRLLRKTGFRPGDPNCVLMCGSSIDFPEEDGAPKGFDGRAVVREACSFARRD